MPGIYPDAVRRLVAIEGLGALPRRVRARRQRPIAERMRSWIDEERALSGRLPRRYASLEDAFARMQEANAHLSAEQALHLTQHGVNQNEDGSYSWKFDNYVRAEPPYDMTTAEIAELSGPHLLPGPARLRQRKLGLEPAGRRPDRPLSRRPGGELR